MDLRQNVRLQVLRLEHLRHQGQAAAIPGIADPPALAAAHLERHHLVAVLRPKVDVHIGPALQGLMGRAEGVFLMEGGHVVHNGPGRLPLHHGFGLPADHAMGPAVHLDIQQLRLHRVLHQGGRNP